MLGLFEPRAASSLNRSAAVNVRVSITLKRRYFCLIGNQDPGGTCPCVQPKQMGRADDLWMNEEVGPWVHNKAGGPLHLPRRWRCRLLGIWVKTGPREWSRTGWGVGSDTALLYCTPLVCRPWRRFKDGDDAEEEDAEAGGEHRGPIWLLKMYLKESCRMRRRRKKFSLEGDKKWCAAGPCFCVAVRRTG